MANLPFPYPVLGRTYDSNGTLLPNTVVYVTSGIKTLTLVSNSGGKYVGNIMDYAYSGCIMSANAVGKGEKLKNKTFKVVTSSMTATVNINLTESNQSGKISMNTARDYNNKAYIFTPLCNKIWCKTIDD